MSKGVDLWRELALVYRRDRSLPRAVSGPHQHDSRKAASLWKRND